MARLCNIDIAKKDFLTMLHTAVQSANLNFLIGSGCTAPAIPILGNIEDQVQKKITEDKRMDAEKLIFDFLNPFLNVTNELLGKPGTKVNETIENYKLFLTIISQILFKRKNNLLPRQATVFSTNYDLFVEKAFEGIETLAKLNDGFDRNPSLTNCFHFSSSEFFNSIYNNGNLYNYEVSIPSINLVKLHGSFSWKTLNNKIVFCIDDYGKLISEYKKLSEENDLRNISEFNKQFSFILPKKDKFRDTILNQTYYDLLRLYANELDKENTLLIVDGFSFADEHILEITTRSLKNPTLKIIIFCYTSFDLEKYKQMFSSFNNVDIVYSVSGKIDFQQFNLILEEVLPLDYKSDSEMQQGEINE